MFIKEQGQDAAIIFGRFNPPHQGHVAAWKEAAKFPIWYVGTNKSTQGPKDPLPYDIKIKAMEALYPEIKGHLVAEKTWFTLAAMVYAKHGAVTLHIVTDQQDSATYVAMLKKQNGVDGQHGFYNFKNIVWQPAPRLSSATDLRAAVAANDPTAFSKAAGVPADTKIDGKPFFNLVKFYLDAQAKPVKEVTEQSECPPATQDITLNLENRQKAIDEYGYGPLNPAMPNNKFWMKKVDEWNLDSAEEAKKSLCGNCAAFDVRRDTLDCIATGIDAGNPADAEGVIDAGDLGYCKFLKFKCASRRTCDAWVGGGPLTDKEGLEETIRKLPNGKFRLLSKKGNKNLGTFDSKKAAEKHEREVQYFKHMNEEGGVGVVANNAKQAKDPRYVMSMTNDVKPGETQRQAKKMGFKLDKKGMPPLAHKSAAKNTSPNKAYNLGLAESKSVKRKK